MNEFVVSLPSLFPMQSGSREIFFNYLASQNSFKPPIDELGWIAFVVSVVASSVLLLLLRYASKRYMVLRIIEPAASPDSGKDRAWAAFLPSHTGRISLHGCISPPAHAALAGRLAAALNGKIFEALQEEILDSIANHDAGWSEEDLAALEQAEHNPPMSLFRCRL
jgi:hypothetical protein